MLSANELDNRVLAAVERAKPDEVNDVIEQEIRKSLKQLKAAELRGLLNELRDTRFVGTEASTHTRGLKPNAHQTKLVDVILECFKSRARYFYPNKFAR